MSQYTHAAVPQLPLIHVYHYATDPIMSITKCVNDYVRLLRHWLTCMQHKGAQCQNKGRHDQKHLGVKVYRLRTTGAQLQLK